MREDKVIEIPRMIGQVTRKRREELRATAATCSIRGVLSASTARG